MTETLDSTLSGGDAADKAPKKRGGGLNSMLLADLKAMAGGMGIAGAGSMKKAQLVDAIKAAQRGGDVAPARGGERDRAPERAARTAAEKPDDQPGGKQEKAREPEKSPRQDDQAQQDKKSQDQQSEDKQSQDQQDGQARQGKQTEQRKQGQQGGQQSRQGKQAGGQEKQSPQDKQSKQAGGQDNQSPQDKQGKQGGGQDNQGQQDKPGQQGQDDDQDGDGEGGSRRNRRRRGRDRDRANRPGTREPDTEVREDDVLVPAAGILDILDNYAFVRTSGYLPGADDVYLSLSLVRKFGLRRGDAVAGQVRQPREGERREKFNPMVRIDSVNGVDPEHAKTRVDFSKLTPLHPSERLRMETGPEDLTGRIIDIAAPIGKGQRGLVISPAKSGKTTVLRSIATSITANNPECHLMVVLVDERPEEVTDFERSIKGEVIASTFDRPASDHAMVAELAIERAKRLVELGHDVVVLLDGITRLGRAYNLSTPASGRILSGGVDSAALYPPKRFFGAARNIENGGSLTIIATALVESGSKMDEVIFEDFEGTANMELRLRHDFAEKRIFPAIDAVASGTRREELLMSKEEVEIVWKLRRVLSDLDPQQAVERLLERLRTSQTNYELLVRVQKAAADEI